MYVNAKMTLVKTIPGTGKGADKEEWWRCELRYHVFDML
jgi:hypothetical protein